MNYYGIKPGGEAVLLPAPSEAKYDSSEDVPADSFQGVFPIQKSYGTLTGIKIQDEKGDEKFVGTVDIQREISSGSGNALHLICRSLAGLLLDSEPVPQSYDYPTLPAIFERHIKPYGLTGFLGSTMIFQGPLRIVKGTSEWQTAAEFCKTYLQVSPRVRGSVFDASGKTATDEIRFDNSLGIRYFRAEIKNRFCDRFSTLYTRNADTGTYLPTAQDEETNALGIVRGRCLTNPSADTETILKKADQKAFTVLVDCPGNPLTETGAPASLNDSLLGSLSGLRVAQISCTVGSGGVWTRYRLRK